MRTRGTPFKPVSEPLERRRLFASTSTLLQYDFNTGTSWQQSPGAATVGVTAVLNQGGYGTIDTEGGTAPTGALRLSVNAAPTTPWYSDLTSGQLAVTNTETNLGKLTLSFNLSASQLKPVRVIVSSYSAAGVRTGGLETTIIPASTYYNQRFALDLSTMTASGTGTFNPTNPFVSFDFEINSQNGWTTASAAQLRLDNVNYAKPAYYVSPTGSNNGGKTEATAFKTPQQALNVAQPGDIILLMTGTYSQVTANTGAIQFQNSSGQPIAGTPADWITVKNYPGQTPVIYNEAWSAIKIGASAATTNSAIAYVELRGLTLQGDSAKVGSFTAPDGVYNASDPNAGQYGVYGQYAGISDARSNGNGISIDGRYETNKPHDIRIADNIVQNMAGAGIGAGDCDRVQIENNITRDNCYWDIYATSGISVLSAYNFDGTSGTVTRLVRNNISSGNIHKEIWASHNGYSDGNGIIIDINKYAATSTTAAQAAVGRTLVTNNVCFNNGGSGIHSFDSDHVDIVNNVAYLNSASPHLQYGEIFSNGSSDVRIYNNILVAPTAATGQPSEPLIGGTTPTASNGIIYNGNVYSGGNTGGFAANAYNINNITADPKFVLPSIDAAVANFHLQSTSPAINRGTTALAPYLDLGGALRYGNPDSGAYEFIPAAPATVTLAAASDTGVVGDNKTKLNNASSTSRLSFTVTGTLSGATVLLYSGSTLLGSATATGTTTVVLTNGAAALADGAASITATQTFAGAPSTASPALAITVDSASPTLIGTPVINAGAVGRSQVGTVAWTFSEPVVLGLGDLVLTNLDTGQVVSLSTRTLSVSGNTVTLNLDRPGVDPTAQLFLANANFEVDVLPTITDTAGNTLDANGDGTPGETAAFKFYKLLGDYNGDRSTNFSDFLMLQNAYGSTTGLPAYNAQIDHNSNGVIDFADFLVFQNAFNGSVPQIVANVRHAKKK